MQTFENYHKIYLYIEPLVDDEKDARERMHLSHLFCFLEDYLNLTINQYDRVKENHDSLKNYAESKKELHHCMNIMFGDIHFMLISMEKAYSLSMRMLEILKEKETVKEIRESNAYKTVKFFRNNLEHMNDKLTIEDHKYRESWYSSDYHTHWFARQWGSMHGNTIKLGNYSFSVEETSLEPLLNIYHKIFGIITERYIIPNKEVVDRIFKGHMPLEW
ncbi:hypothetical protein B5E84_17930 [Lachnoclostridium sp. An14]|uniref:hypothetical protein n=1 Tax=Lachnoclostridium sp. An14 TaxID=1965562 RepID=UPI000B39F4C3|nr:hypothetical protein [Lachnoclostridium sp. An14]OUQ13131.1 hypothetical protein B5E84_17930 [Lachnoclostridium sp. An14]